MVTLHAMSLLQAAMLDGAEEATASATAEAEDEEEDDDGCVDATEPINTSSNWRKVETTKLSRNNDADEIQREKYAKAAAWA